MAADVHAVGFSQETRIDVRVVGNELSLVCKVGHLVRVHHHRRMQGSQEPEH